MSGPSAAYAEPREREDAQGDLLKPGQVLELAKLETLFDDLSIEFGKLQQSHHHDAYASFEAIAQRFSVAAARFSKSVTTNRPRPPKGS